MDWMITNLQRKRTSKRKKEKTPAPALERAFLFPRSLPVGEKVDEGDKTAVSDEA